MDEIKSVRNTEQVFVRFVNATQCSVDVIWVNFTGSFVNYQQLEPGDYVDVNTYKQHPWIVVDHNTHDRLHVNKQFVYFPKTFKEYMEERFPGRKLNFQLENTRIQVTITLPIYSLRYRTLLQIRSLLKVPEDADALELPKELKEDLRKLIVQRNTQVIYPLIRIR